MYYDDVLLKLNLNNIIKFKSLDLDFDEILGLEIPFNESIGFPPALIPIASSLGGFSYTGVYLTDIVNNDFVFVDFLVDDNNKIYEVALTEKQFSLYIVRRAMLDYFDDDVEDQIKTLCNCLGISNFMDIADLEDDEFLELNEFKPDAPKYLTSSLSGFSIENEPVLETGNLKEKFDHCLYNNDFQGAWKYLNQPGWLLSDAKDNFKLLIERSNHKLLLDIFNVWSSLKHPTQGY